MASGYKVLNAAEMNAQEKELSLQEESLASSTNKSSDFWGSSTPSSKSVQDDIRLRDLRSRQERLSSNLIARDMYGLQTDADKDTSKIRDEGLIMKGIDILSRPLYGVVGAASHLTGKGQDTFGESVMSGVRERETWGSLLKRSNVAPSVAMTLGFGLDVLTDPINLLSGGTVGFSRTGIGKVATGASKAGVKGVKAAVEASATKSLYNMTKLVPGLSVNKKMAKVLAKMEGKGISVESPEFVKAIGQVYSAGDSKVGKAIGTARVAKTKLGEAASKAGERYDSLVNFDINSVLENRANRESVASMMTSKMEEVPLLAKAMKQLKYSSNDWSRDAKMMDEVEYALGKRGKVIKQVRDPLTGQMGSPKMKDLEEFFTETAKGTPEYLDPKNLSRAEIKRNISSMIDEGDDILKQEKINFPDTVFSRKAMAEEAKSQALFESYNETMKDVISRENLGAAKKIDDYIAKKFVIKDVEVGKKILKGLDIYRGLFVSAKISSLSPSSMIYAIVGNPTMTLLAGLNPVHPDNFVRFKDAMAVVFGKDKKRAAEVFHWMSTGQMGEFYAKRANTFIDTYGISLSHLGIKDATEKIMRELSEAGMLKGIGNEERQMLVARKMREIFDKTEIKQILKNSKPNEWDDVKKSVLREGRDSTFYLQNELENLPTFSRFKKEVKAVAKEGSGAKQTGAKALNFMFDRSKDFQKVDQVYKLKDFFRLTRDGITQNELLKMTNNYMATTAKVHPDDIASSVWKNGTKYFKIKPDKAMEITNEVYMNYAAMPAFIRSLRALKIGGAPFFAFTYAMLQKTGKAALNNPAAFNKINFLMQELEKDKSPLEREALKSKYYNYLSKPGMINLGENIPFFKGHPLYMNLAQMIPYYSLGIINPSERGFNDGTVRGQLSTTIDKAPVFDDPIGQLILDYILLPAIVRDQDPVNMWGGPLYAKDATTLNKFGHAGRSLLEALVPSTVGAVAAPFLSDKQMKFLPSYPGRKFGFATRGKTAVGVLGRESPASRGLRASLSLAGINLYPMDLTNISNEIKKR